MSAWHRKIQAHSAGVKCPKTRAQMSGYGATSASSRKIKVTMREHEGGDKLQRNCCFLFALVVGALAAAFVAHGQRETSLSLEWTETDVVAVKAGNRIHYDDDVADDTTSSSDTENYSFWGFVSECDDSTKVLQVLLKIVGVWPFVLLGLVALAQHPSLRRRKASENFVLLLCHAGRDSRARAHFSPPPSPFSHFTRYISRDDFDARARAPSSNIQANGRSRTSGSFRCVRPRCGSRHQSRTSRKRSTSRSR